MLKEPGLDIYVLFCNQLDFRLCISVFIYVCALAGSSVCRLPGDAVMSRNSFFCCRWLTGSQLTNVASEAKGSANMTRSSMSNSESNEKLFHRYVFESRAHVALLTLLVVVTESSPVTKKKLRHVNEENAAMELDVRVCRLSSDGRRSSIGRFQNDVN